MADSWLQPTTPATGPPPLSECVWDGQNEFRVLPKGIVSHTFIIIDAFESIRFKETAAQVCSIAMYQWKDPRENLLRHTVA